MKKIYSLITAFALIGSGVLAQSIQEQPASKIIETKNAPVSFNKAAAAVIKSYDFSNPNDWEAQADDDTHGWQITDTVKGWAPTSRINSTSKGNYALFTNGNPNTPTNTPGEWSIGNAVPVDLSAYSGVAFTYQIWGARFTDDVVLEVSTDKSSWTIIDQISKNVRSLTSVQPVNDFTNATTRYALGTGIAGQSTVYFRFRWFSTDTRNIAYSYQIDDVNIIEAPAKALSVANVTFDGALETQFCNHRELPLSQTHKFNPFLHVINGGSLDQTVVVTATYELDGTTVGTFTSAPKLVKSTGDSLIIMETIEPNAVGTYKVTYTVSAPNDTNPEVSPADNSISEFFYITDSIYSDDLDRVWRGNGYLPFLDGGTGPQFAELGACQSFQIYTDGQKAFSITTVFPAFSNSAFTADQELNIDLYRFNDLTKYNATFSKTDMTNVASTTYAVDAADISPAAGPTKYTTIYFGSTPALTPGVYVAEITSYGGSDRYNLPVYAGTSTDGSGILRGSIQANTAIDRYTHFNISPFIKLNLQETYPTLGINQAEVMNFALGQNQPNPASGVTTIGYELKEAGVAALNIVDITGKTIVSENFGKINAGSYTYVVNGSSLNKGVYFYSLTVNGKKITKKMVISE